jgi:hypothetical protein
MFVDRTLREPLNRLIKSTDLVDNVIKLKLLNVIRLQVVGFTVVERKELLGVGVVNRRLALNAFTR